MPVLIEATPPVNGLDNNVALLEGSVTGLGLGFADERTVGDGSVLGVFVVGTAD